MLTERKIEVFKLKILRLYVTNRPRISFYAVIEMRVNIYDFIA